MRSAVWSLENTHDAAAEMHTCTHAHMQTLLTAMIHADAGYHNFTTRSESLLDLNVLNVR